MKSIYLTMKKTGLAMFLVGSLPFVMGQGGCETLNLSDIGAISSGINSNIERSKGNYRATAGWAGASQLFGIASQREYQNRQGELERNAQIEAANIRAQAERDAANIRAQSSAVINNPSSIRYPVKTEVTEEITDPILNNLRKLKELKNAGIFTEEEYQIKRKEIIKNAYK